MSWNRIVKQTALTELIDGDIGICKQGGVQKDFEMGTLFNSKITGSTDQMAKAWVNFNAVGTVAIRDSLNVSSITDHGTGQHAVNFATNMNNANYVMTGLAYGRNIAEAIGTNLSIDSRYTPSISSFRVLTKNDWTSGAVDYDYVTVAVFGT